jgi:hypothetical protein
MPDDILPLRSFTVGAVPTTSEISINELAINWADGKAFSKDAAGNIVSVTLGGNGANIVEVPTVSTLPSTGVGAINTIYIATDVSRAFRFDASGVYIEIGN